jgi:zinc/manganese transport system substrate-binding protein
VRIILAIVMFSQAVLAYAAEPIPVVVSFSILADLTKRIGGERIRLHTLVGPNADVHVYRPTPADAKALAGARLVVVNGLGFEAWMERLVKSSGYRGPVVVASRGARLRTASPDAHSHSHGQKHSHGHAGDTDPHAWLDPANAAIYVSNLTQALSTLDPSGAPIYQAAEKQVLGQIRELDEALRAQFAGLPDSRRNLVSAHDSFGYFGRAYNLNFHAAQGPGAEAGTSARQLAQLIRQIKRDKIAAVFPENISDPRLLERIRSETGARIGGTLYSDALSGPEGPASSWFALMRHNATTVLAALQ